MFFLVHSFTHNACLLVAFQACIMCQASTGVADTPSDIQKSCHVMSPANFSKVKCVRFSIPTLPQFLKMSDDFLKFPKITEGFRRVPSIAEDDLTTSDHTSCFDKLTTEFTFNWSTSKKLAFVSQA